MFWASVLFVVQSFRVSASLCAFVSVLLCVCVCLRSCVLFSYSVARALVRVLQSSLRQLCCSVAVGLSVFIEPAEPEPPPALFICKVGQGMSGVVCAAGVQNDTPK